MNGISNVTNQAGASIPSPNRVQKPEVNFKDTLGEYLNGVNNAIKEAGATAGKMVTGEVTDIHEVMIASEKAGVGLELVVEIRNKLLESYREFMRMQV